MLLRGTHAESGGVNKLISTSGLRRKGDGGVDMIPAIQMCAQNCSKCLSLYWQKILCDKHESEWYSASASRKDVGSCALNRGTCDAEDGAMWRFQLRNCLISGEGRGAQTCEHTMSRWCSNLLSYAPVVEGDSIAGLLAVAKGRMGSFTEQAPSDCQTGSLCESTR